MTYLPPSKTGLGWSFMLPSFSKASRICVSLVTRLFRSPQKLRGREGTIISRWAIYHILYHYICIIAIQWTESVEHAPLTSRPGAMSSTPGPAPQLHTTATVQPAFSIGAGPECSTFHKILEPFRRSPAQVQGWALQRRRETAPLQPPASYTPKGVKCGGNLELDMRHLVSHLRQNLECWNGFECIATTYLELASQPTKL